MADETLFTDILTRLRPGYDNGGEVKKRGPKGPIKGSAISKFSEFLRKLSPEKIATTNINDLI